MSKKKAKKLEVREGSRLLLKDGKFARLLEDPKNNDTTIMVKVYCCGKDDVDEIRSIPIGHVKKVVRY